MWRTLKAVTIDNLGITHAFASGSVFALVLSIELLTVRKWLTCATVRALRGSCCVMPLPFDS